MGLPICYKFYRTFNCIQESEDVSSDLNPIQQLDHLGQSVWYDNMYRSLIDSGELQRLIDVGVTGLTSNPTIFEKAISSSDDYDESLIALSSIAQGPEDLFEALAIQDIQAAADLLHPVFERSSGADGFASLEVNPHLAHDTDGTVAAAKRLFSALDRPNVMIKVPATPAGIPAIRTLIGQGINVNVTLIFSLEMYARVREAYISGLEDLIETEGDASRVSSVASFFVSRVDTAVDGIISGGGAEVRPLMGRAAVANAKIAYQDFQETFQTDRFGALEERGARVQRPLWASTSTKNPDYSDVMYVESLIGPHTVNTMPDVTLAAFLEHGTAQETIGQDVDESWKTIRKLESAGVSMNAVTEQLMHDGVKAFADSFDELITNIAAKRDRLLTAIGAPVGVSLGKAQATADQAVASLQESDAVARIWSRDHTLWSSDPAEISDRLGWLDVASSMLAEVEDLTAFAAAVRSEGIRHVVLLGMGGSSLGPEVLRQCFGQREGCPELIVLDSTIPARINSVVHRLDPARALILVSSKSGTTVEPNTLYLFFRQLLEAEIGVNEAGSRFIAITDPGTPLDDLARRDGFRRTFRNRPDVGGRYSVMSHFGMVPAALIGCDVHGLLNSAIRMQTACGPDVDAAVNPGAWLGAVLGSLALAGRDKLTILTSPRLSSFSLWAEQLVAESLGKSGTGIIPISGESPAMAAQHPDDRQYVYLKLSGDDSKFDDTANNLSSQRHPVVRYEIESMKDLGGEFYRWEFAIATAGAVMGVHPFDQPNVQQAKDITESALARFESEGVVPGVGSEGSLTDLIADMDPGDYLAILAYMDQTPEIDSALAELRSTLSTSYRIRTTLGYGPRYLHSIGQLHKGGPDNVAALVLTSPHVDDVDVPANPFTFGVLADAQASSDILALRSAGRRVVSVALAEPESTQVSELSELLLIQQA